MKTDDVPEIHIYTDDEIELILNGDRRIVDRLLMQGLNNIAAVLLPHMHWEEKILHSLGTEAEIRTRITWIETQVERQRIRNQMMQKISESALAWAFIAFIGFVMYSAWEHIVSYARFRQDIPK